MSIIGVRAANGRSYFCINELSTFVGNAQILISAGQRAGGTANVEELGTNLRGADSTAPSNEHDMVCSFVDTVATLGTASLDFRGFNLARRCAEHSLYLSEKAREVGAGEPSTWRQAGIAGTGGDLIGVVVSETVQHIGALSEPNHCHQSMIDYTALKVDRILPPQIAELRHEANLSLIYPFFERSMTVPGDICEFGCFRGYLSIKLAWLAKALGTTKTYYAFDTFGGFEIADPGGGQLGVGAFEDNHDSLLNLTKWSKILPIVPMKGDATKTVAQLTQPLSFVWLDLDMAVLMDPVLRQIWGLCGPDTIIGIDDVGRPETPTVGPWVERLTSSGAAETVFNSDEIAPNTHIRFVRKTGDLPA